MRGEITVREALRLRSLSGARVVGGSGGLERPIRAVNVMEVPDILPFVKPHELLLTTAYPIRDDPAALERLVPALESHGLAAIAIVPRAFLCALPPGAVERADKVRFPLIELPEQASFNEIMAEVFERILDRQAMQLQMRRYEAVLLDELVSDRSGWVDGAVEHARLLGWDLRIPRVALAVELRERGSGAIVAVAGKPVEDVLLRTIASALGDVAISWAGGAGLSLLVDARPEPRAVARQLRDAVRRAAPELRVGIGIGRPSDGAAGLRRSFRDATQAVAIGREIEGEDAIIHYDELGVHRLLHRLVADPELRRFCDDTIGRLVAHDRGSGTELVATLERYLRNERNVAATARDLSIHYNTLRYRLRKIDELVGGIDRHSGSRLGLELALHAWRMLAGPGGEDGAADGKTTRSPSRSRATRAHRASIRVPPAASTGAPANPPPRQPPERGGEPKRDGPALQTIRPTLSFARRDAQEFSDTWLSPLPSPPR
ncbi:MAG TPA: PucR family transcriptional regulator ligand-binding domain-containing protein [Candidatus Limnocylindria bacterium]|nr:PucR family transcriptional regulator ligand-binding domain-containing protein [Candidatus Limnocylindria bacterium]